MGDECVVLIPVYKREMSELELLSFKQALKVFDRPIVLYGPDNLDYSIYTDTARVNGREVGIQVFDKRYFGSVKDYNDLCLLRDFYIVFNRYEYMLLYQLDAYVFEDRLDYYMAKNCSFVGAPCFEGLSKAKDTVFTGHLNGGLSLRRVDDFIEVCDKACSLRGVLRLIGGSYLEYRDFIKYILFKLGRYAHLPFKWEDMFFSFGAKILKSDFRLADYEDARSFSFDFLPELLYKETGKLPMGCHAFDRKANIDFWKGIIGF